MSRVSALYATAAEAVAKATRVSEGMAQLFQGLKADCPNPIWGELEKVPYASDAPRFQAWIKELLTRQPPASKISTLSVVLQDLSTPELEGTRTRVKDDEWPDEEAAYQPEQKEPNLEAPDRFWDLFDKHEQETGSLSSTDAEYVVGLSYYGLLLKDAARDLGPKLFLGDAKKRQLAIGWHDGDCLVLGDVTAEGLKVPKPKKITILFSEALSEGLIAEKMRELLEAGRDPSSGVAKMLAVAPRVFGESPMLKKIKPGSLIEDVSTLSGWMAESLLPMMRQKEYSAVSFSIADQGPGADASQARGSKGEPAHVAFECRIRDLRIDYQSRTIPREFNTFPTEIAPDKLSIRKLSDHLFSQHDESSFKCVDFFLVYGTLALSARLMADRICTKLNWGKYGETLLLTGDLPSGPWTFPVGSITPDGWIWRDWQISRWRDRSRTSLPKANA